MARFTEAQYRAATGGRKAKAGRPRKLIADVFEPPATWTTGLFTCSEANRRDHWRVKNKRKKHQQAVIGVALNQYPRAVKPFVCLLHGGNRVTVKLTRLAPGALADDDNIRSAFKGIRDRIALVLHVDDGSPLVTWEYRQERSNGYGVRIEMRKT